MACNGCDPCMASCPPECGKCPPAENYTCPDGTAVSDPSKCGPSGDQPDFWQDVDDAMSGKCADGTYPPPGGQCPPATGGMSMPPGEVQCIDGSTAPFGKCPGPPPQSTGSKSSGGGSGGGYRSAGGAGGTPPTTIVLRKGKRGKKVKAWQRALNVHTINRLKFGVGESGLPLTKAQSMAILEKIAKEGHIDPLNLGTGPGNLDPTEAVNLESQVPPGVGGSSLNMGDTVGNPIGNATGGEKSGTPDAAEAAPPGPTAEEKAFA